ncbi:Las1-domain-containing protein [Trametopsis cervina]|nr:Las1-domain-containing protein [Trametopsis cervina]
MRLPRRVPWASLAELDQVYSWIYADENDLDAKVLAVNRLAAWRVMTTIPHALESTHSILSVILQDTSSQGASSFLPLRQAYAAAIIRLVNGLVDPLQLGAYARSISSIAAQLGLPAWLVELRHAATHEDLPSLEVLREAARECMAWLLHNYFIPALNPSAVEAAPKQAALRPLEPLLTEYKTLLKTVTRDASLRTQHKHNIIKVQRDIERWISEAKLAADVTAATLEWDDVQMDEDAEGVDSREWWALQRLCDGLLAKGGLIPMSKKKRSIVGAFEPSPSLIAIWTPLLTQLTTLHPSFPSVLTTRIISLVLTTDTPNIEASADTISLTEDASARDLSFELCAASWANWLVDRFSDPNGPDEDDRRARRASAVAALVSGMGVSRMDRETDHKAAHRLLKVLCAKDPKLQTATELLLSASVPDPSDTDLDTMSKRMEALVAATESTYQDETNGEPDGGSTVPGEGTEAGPELPIGWRLLTPRDGWKPTPIGVSYRA